MKQASEITNAADARRYVEVWRAECQSNLRRARHFRMARDGQTLAAGLAAMRGARAAESFKSTVARLAREAGPQPERTTAERIAIIERSISILKSGPPSRTTPKLIASHERQLIELKALETAIAAIQASDLRGANGARRVRYAEMAKLIGKRTLDKLTTLDHLRLTYTIPEGVDFTPGHESYMYVEEM